MSHLFFSNSFFKYFYKNKLLKIIKKYKNSNFRYYFIFLSKNRYKILRKNIVGNLNQFLVSLQKTKIKIKNVKASNQRVIFHKFFINLYLRSSEILHYRYPYEFNFFKKIKTGLINFKKIKFINFKFSKIMKYSFFYNNNNLLFFQNYFFFFEICLILVANVLVYYALIF